jgi:hypothetical protein
MVVDSMLGDVESVTLMFGAHCDALRFGIALLRVGATIDPDHATLPLLAERIAFGSADLAVALESHSAAHLVEIADDDERAPMGPPTAVWELFPTEAALVIEAAAAIGFWRLARVEGTV